MPLKITGEKVAITSAYVCRSHTDHEIFLRKGRIYPQCPHCATANNWLMAERLVVKQLATNVLMVTCENILF